METQFVEFPRASRRGDEWVITLMGRTIDRTNDADACLDLMLEFCNNSEYLEQAWQQAEDTCQEHDVYLCPKCFAVE